MTMENYTWQKYDIAIEASNEAQNDIIKAAETLVRAHADMASRLEKIQRILDDWEKSTEDPYEAVHDIQNVMKYGSK
jgi:uncharacterized protein Usg